MEIIDTINQLVEYGLAFAVLGGVAIALITDSIRSGKAADRENNRERELTNRALDQVDGLTDALQELSNAWEKRNDLEEALRQDREGRR